MKGETGERRRYLLWGIPASLILHVLVAALLIYGLPVPPQQPQEEQPVNVALVPPDQPKPAPVPAPKPSEPKPSEQKVEKPLPPQKQPQKPPPVEVLKPVFQFGDKDTGPRKSLDGASAQDSSPSPAKDDASKPPVVPKQAEDKSAAPAEAHDADKQTAASATPLAAAGSDGEIELPMSAETPRPKPANAPKANPFAVSKSGSGSTSRPSSPDAAIAKSRAYSGLPGIRKLYSQGATGDALATTSMGGVPRGRRAATLCASALQQQLLDASYFPELIPSVPLKVGNILDAPDVAFRTTNTWYHLSFRCEVDTDATRVLSFTFRVGDPIPRDDWVRLGLPVR
ncbi:DUF930 domain-containing protein [Mesorhizobium qingshengii]|uniref:DUF930 domain-containing protein n=1 Tax=Mesorhizobium qingshengii TaxID=1165689 RepID=A0ABT4R300_9HYPH|nr:DUF930 domain-containing protein [Mesorhizobium qingshengii]MCZ8548217.1 DUF930 domain-containing protein [Mesorhizobium qingshengii]